MALETVNEWNHLGTKWERFLDEVSKAKALRLEGKMFLLSPEGVLEIKTENPSLEVFSQYSLTPPCERLRF